MTAEVAVLNSIGVALAADSAVSVGMDAEKIYTSADKLFQLHSSAPVGIMIYGSANISGIPWETVIKEFRRQLGTERFPALADYSVRFIEFLKNSPKIFSDARERLHIGELASGVFFHLRGQLRLLIEKEIEENGSIDEARIAELAEVCFKHCKTTVARNPLLPFFKQTDAATIIHRYKQELLESKKRVFENLPMGKRAEKLLFSCLSELLIRQCFGPMQTGVVIAGFGEEDFLPTLFAMEIEGFVLGLPRATAGNVAAISDDNLGAIIPFAQQEMVHSFMEGADRELMAHIRNSTSALFSGVVDTILSIVASADALVAEKLKTGIRPELDNSLQELFQDWNGRCQMYWSPVLQIVATLPKDELSAMAEALVNLTKFRRRVTRVRETVGGPIDVAVITKGDGFVWIKRKHYFSPELNPRILAKYGTGDQS